MEGNEITQQMKKLEELQSMGIDVDVSDEEMRLLADEIAAELPEGPVKLSQEQPVTKYTEEKRRETYVV